MRILIVDDEPVIRNGLMKMVESHSPHITDVRTAENGLVALDMIKQEMPDFVLTDIRMPKMDGLELCKMINEQYSHIQIVVISGYGEFTYAQKCMNYGVKHYLLKPVTKIDIDELFANLLANPTKGYIPFTRFLEYIKQMELAIWHLQQEELSELIEQWQEQCYNANLSILQLQELLNDCMETLLNRFAERNYNPDLTHYKISSSTNFNKTLQTFKAGLREIFNQLQASRDGNFKDPMEEARAYIDSRLAQDISLDEVANMIGLSPTYFSALFKKNTGETFVHYRINRRMERAKELLAVPHSRIVDVAVNVGYEDYSHFTKTFKKIFGISPSEYRSSLGIK